VSALELLDEHLRVVVEPDLGAHVSFVGRPGGPNVLAEADWASPLPASRSAGYGSDRADFMSEYRGGWHELFPNAGDACEVDGVRLPFHGEAARARWDVVEAQADSLRVRTAARLPLVLERRMRLAGDRATVTVEEVVTNESATPVEFVWGHHPVFPAVPGTEVDVPAATVRADAGFAPAAGDVEPDASGEWPFLPGPGGRVDLRRVPDGPAERYCFMCDLPEGWAAVRDVSGGTGVALSWDVEVWPHAWLWLELGGEGFPWYGRGAFLGVEPQRSWPGDGLAAARERGHALRVEGGGRVASWLTFSLFDADEREVERVGRDGAITRREERG
jgi:galactose mutarotase-like enzyme